MGEDRDARVLLPEGLDLVAGEALVDLAVARPEDDLDGGLRRHVAAEVLVGQEDHALGLSDSTTSTALADVQQTSDSAFTSAEVLT